MKELSDIRPVSQLDVTPAGIGRFVQFDQQHADALDGHLLALLVPSDLVFGMGRMYEQRGADVSPSVRVFRDEAEARAWLGLNTD